MQQGVFRTIFLLSITFFLSHCGSNTSSADTKWKIKDVSQRSERISLLMESVPTKAELSIQGTTDNNYKILLAGNQNAGNVNLNFPAGNIDTTIVYPWTSDFCKVIYLPNRVTSGDLAIDLKLMQK